MRTAIRRALRALVLLPAVATPAAQAAVAVFAVDPARSQLSMSGTIDYNGQALSPLQQPVSGSMLTSYSGTIRLDTDFSTIVFQGGVLDATVNGTYAPGPAPADYGVYAPGTGGMPNVYGALRDFTFSITGTPFPAGSGFDLSGVAVTALSGTFEIDASRQSRWPERRPWRPRAPDR